MAEVTFPQLIQRACGIDVHLKVVVATINGEGLKKETRSFGTFTSSLNELKEWLLSNNVTHVAMESTGAYWKPVYKVLEGSIPKMIIRNQVNYFIKSLVVISIRLTFTSKAYRYETT